MLDGRNPRGLDDFVMVGRGDLHAHDGWCVRPILFLECLAVPALALAAPLFQIRRHSTKLFSWNKEREDDERGQ